MTGLRENCNRLQRISSVTAGGINSGATSACRFMAMPANTPATVST
jgi:hypothetical protein